MTTTQELDSVINALSRTIAELRETKEKLAKAEAIQSQNLEVKKNLALRINELQKEADAIKAKAAEELKAEQRKTEIFERILSNSFVFNTPTPQVFGQGWKFDPSRDFISHYGMYGRESDYQIISPQMAIRFSVNEPEISRWDSYFPMIRESIARKMAADMEKYVYGQVSKLLQEVKCPASK